jgi:hypothetical protein
MTVPCPFVLSLSKDEWSLSAPFEQFVINVFKVTWCSPESGKNILG